MAARAKAKNAKNHWRQREYLRIGTVMLPTLREERIAMAHKGMRIPTEAIKSKR